MTTSFQTYLTDLQQVNLPKFADLPQFDLYMDQVIGLVNDYIKPLNIDPITSSMINNYVKHKVIQAPVKKKYTNYQLANILVIALLKNVFTLDEIQRGIQLQVNATSSQQAYDTFITKLLDTLHIVPNQATMMIKDVAQNDTDTPMAMINLACNVIVQKLLVEQMLK